MKPSKIILASRSPRRSQLLQWAEIEFDIMSADTDENYPAYLSPTDVAIHIACNKATDVKSSFQLGDANGGARTILAADTIVVLDNKIIGKPSTRQDAINTLSMLSGRSHHVITGVCILANEKKIVFAEQTKVEFFQLRQSELEYYVDNYKPYDKAGAYAIQEWIGVTGIKTIIGDFYNVMGLPVSRVVKELRKLEEE